MDRRVKQRIVGAAILMALVVVLVPEFLSGPAPPAPPAPATSRTYTVEVAPSAAPPSATAVVAPAAAPSVPATPSGRAEPPAESPPVDVTHAAWSVQLGSFSRRANAEALRRKLQPLGYAVYVSASGTGAGARYRVRIGPIADRSAAERTIAKLQAQGHPASLVAPAP